MKNMIENAYKSHGGAGGMNSFRETFGAVT